MTEDFMKSDFTEAEVRTCALTPEQHARLLKWIDAQTYGSTHETDGNYVRAAEMKKYLPEAVEDILSGNIDAQAECDDCNRLTHDDYGGLCAQCKIAALEALWQTQFDANDELSDTNKKLREQLKEEKEAREGTLQAWQDSGTILNEQLLDHKERVEELRKYIADVRDVLLQPLSNCDSEFGRVAEGFGQLTVSLLAKAKSGGEPPTLEDIHNALANTTQMFKADLKKHDD